MKKQNLYLMFQTLLCVCICAALLYGMISIYAGAGKDGEIYTRQNTFAAFRHAAPLFLLLLAGSIAGWTLRRQNDGKQNRMASQFEYHPEISHISRIRAILFIISAALIVYGILNGSMRDVLYKAITICSECIGLG